MSSINLTQSISAHYNVDNAVQVKTSAITDKPFNNGSNQENAFTPTPTLPNKIINHSILNTNIPDPSVIQSTNLSLSRMNSTQEILSKHPLKDKNLNSMRHNSTTNLHKQFSFSNLANAVPGTALKHQPSKLDLIDDTRLTSLPLPPPPKTRNRSSTSSSNSHTSNKALVSAHPLSGDTDKDNGSTILELKPCQSTDSTHSRLQNKSLGANKHSEDLKTSTINERPSTLDIYEEDDDDYDYDEEESQDPIVLVEDYMATRDFVNNSFNSSRSNEEARIFKKKSLATFKSRMFNNCISNNNNNKHIIDSINNCNNNNNYNISILHNHHEADTMASDASTITSERNIEDLSHSSLISDNSRKRSNKRAISNDIPVRPSGPENLEEIFGKIPGTDLLKYCDLCEKPLYEISSIINNNKKFKKSSQVDSTSAVNQLYTEFICWDCVETYEEFFNELYENDFYIFSNQSEDMNTNEKKSTNEKLLTIFKSIQNKYDQEPKSYTFPSDPKTLNTKTSFSEGLMNRLSVLNNAPRDNNRAIDIDWISNLQNKIRWRWKAATSGHP
ncbi:uncharacterized protein RJT20DRAFT_28948 [Scheffersomyces xylosifermentans]|uniref:uncharacterized protein n=1 Tax=Scheffersomyces xylosifermentans TaxID=1304137 RepID=UPI00315CBFB7